MPSPKPTLKLVDGPLHKVYCDTCHFFLPAARSGRPAVCGHRHAVVRVETWQGIHQERVPPEVRNADNTCPDWQQWHVAWSRVWQHPEFWWLLLLGSLWLLVWASGFWR